MKRLKAVSLLAVALAVALGATALAAGKSSTVSLRTTSLGKILVEKTGHTLYLFEKDTSSKSKCTGKCPSAWPPLTITGKPTAGKGVKASLLKTSKRSDGTTQVVYNGHPLYRFVGDSGPGATKGEGAKAFGADWYVVAASGKKIDNS